MPRHPRPLTPKQVRFIEAYDGNGTAAARKAGYKGNDATLSAVAGENLRKPLIAEAVSKRETKVLNNIIADRAERQAFWTNAMRGAEKDVDRLRASELLGKSQADFVEKHEHNVVTTIRVIDPYAVKK